jgi:hypothetical protein
MSVPKPVIRDTLAERPIAVPLAPGTATAPRERVGIRAWLLTAFLFVVPLLTYWPTTFHDYGLRDDYSNLREAHEEPAVVLNFCASTARPIYGWLLQSTYGQVGTVHGLQWMRLAACLLLGAISLVMFRGLRSLGWSFSASFCFAVLLSLVPSAQVIASWAVGWPYAATALLSIAGFFTVEGALAVGLSAGPARAIGQWTLAAVIMVVCALIYQPSALFYVVPLAGALIARRRSGFGKTLRWLGTHLGFVVVSLGLAYCTMSVLYATGVFVKSGRVAFEQHWGEKIVWFFQEALPNGLSLFALNDNNHRDRGLYLACAGLVGLLLLAGIVVEWRRHGRTGALTWALGLGVLPVFALGISLVASERYATYRTILAMTAVLLCFLVASVSALTETWRAPARQALIAGVLVLGIFAARHHTYALIAVPQGHEWQLVVEAAKQVRLDGTRRPRVFAIASSPADISTASIYHDEFGSLSSNSEWVPREMFKRAMHDLHPGVPNIDSRYDIVVGYKLDGYKMAPGERYDVLVDLRRLRRFYTDD